MIKPNCERCGKPYLGEECACMRGRRPSSLGCDCGEQAEAVWVDEFGEWPLCRTCLRLAEEESAQMPPPRWRKDEVASVPGELASVEKGDELPFGLTMREFQVACLAHYSDKQIAETLALSPHTVHSHLKQVFRKLGIRSRFEIPFILTREHIEGERSDASLWKTIAPLAQGQTKAGTVEIHFSFHISPSEINLSQFLAWLEQEVQKVQTR